MINNISYDHVEISAGKGGVGKSTTSAAKALYYADQGKKTLLIDMDGGRALARVLGINEPMPNTMVSTEIANLHITSVQSMKSFQGKKEAGSYEQFSLQFPDAYGIVCYNAMLLEFFGACTDLPNIHKLVTLSEMIHQAEQNGFEKIIIDVEPTSGLERLFSSLDAVARSLNNLSEMGGATLFALGAKWPDIKKFIQGPYVRQAKYHTARLLKARDVIRQAQFSIISTAEPAPIEQATGEVLDLIKGIGGHVGAIIINNCGRPDVEESIEQGCIDTARRVSERVNAILHVTQHDARFLTPDRRIGLREMGKKIATMTARPVPRKKHKKPASKRSVKPREIEPRTPGRLNTGNSPEAATDTSNDIAVVEYPPDMQDFMNSGGWPILGASWLTNRQT